MRDEILIGEGVVIDARPASFAVRMVGAVLDAVALGALAWILSIVVAVVGFQTDVAAGGALLIVFLVGVFVVDRKSVV